MQLRAPLVQMSVLPAPQLALLHPTRQPRTRTRWGRERKGRAERHIIDYTRSRTHNANSQHHPRTALVRVTSSSAHTRSKARSPECKQEAPYARREHSFVFTAASKVPNSGDVRTKLTSRCWCGLAHMFHGHTLSPVDDAGTNLLDQGRA